MDSLKTKNCQPCKGIPPLTTEEFAPLLKQVGDWSVAEDKKISREFKFQNFASALGFVNKLGIVAEEQQHHPDILIHSWNKVKVTYWTHDIGGLSMNDFIMAAKTDDLV